MNLRKLAFASLIIHFFPHFATAQETAFRVLGVRGQVLLEQRSELPGGALGQATHTILERALAQKKLAQYQGSPGGVSAINGLGSAMEVLSDTDMNAYGWCYRVDGDASDLMADEYRLTGQEAVIEWFYSYAHVHGDSWTSMCVPADHEPVQ